MYRTPLPEQLAALKAEQETDGSLNIAGSGLVRSVTALRANTDHKGYSLKEKPDGKLFATFVFRRLGIDTSSNEFEELLDQQAEALVTEARSSSLEERQKRTVAHIPTGTILRQAFQELNQAVDEFHGSLYDAELQLALMLAARVIETAEAQQPENGLRNAS